MDAAMRRKATALVAALLLAGCNNDGGAPVGFPECTPISRPEIDPVEGLIVPPGSHMYRQKPSGQRLTIVRGFVDMDPIAIRKFYGSLKRKPGYEFFMIEDEVIEAEVFFTDGEWRNYVRARTVCTGRSELFIYVAPEDYGEKVKLPKGAGSRTSP